LKPETGDGAMSSPLEVTIESAKSEDLPAILALLERSGLPLAGYADHLATALVGRQEQRIVASAALEVYGPAVLLRSVAVDASQRGHGLGKRIVLAAVALSREHGAGAIYLLTESAQTFFERLGFKSLPRNAVPATVQASLEFTIACPDTVQAMVLPEAG
jgi:N-acetylglutamate synthase-like GNAT family acetyltransferase